MCEKYCNRIVCSGLAIVLAMYWHPLLGAPIPDKSTESRENICGEQSPLFDEDESRIMDNIWYAKLNKKTGLHHLTYS